VNARRRDGTHDRAVKTVLPVHKVGLRLIVRYGLLVQDLFTGRKCAQRDTMRPFSGGGTDTCKSKHDRKTELIHKLLLSTDPRLHLSMDWWTSLNPILSHRCDILE
jgi:hypothetical protein